MKINQNGDYVLVICPNPSVDIYAWVDKFALGNSNRISKEDRYPGGKGVHVAMALAELDIDVVLIGFWGSVTGEWIKNECNKYYPNINCIGPELASWSRSCYTFKSVSDFDDTEILGSGPEVTANDCSNLLDHFIDHLPNAKAVALSGSWPSGSKEDGYEEMIRYANKHSIPTFLDSTGIQFKNALKAYPYCIHLNRREVLEFTNAKNIGEAQKIIGKDCQTSALTDGENGLTFNDGMNTLHSLSKVDKVYSSIGSGDCLLAGIIAGYVLELEAQEIANLGAACGAANCIRPELGMIYKKDVERLNN